MRSAPAGLTLGVVASLLLVTGGCPLRFFLPDANAPAGTGTLQVLVTDKPYPIDLIDRAEVTITEVWVLGTDIADDDPNAPDDPNELEDDPNDDSAEVGAGDPSDDPNGSGDDDDGEWIRMFAGEKTFDLLDLRNGRTDLLADANLPAGTYKQMRLIVTGGFVQVSDPNGDTRDFDLRVPSGEQTGIKLHFEFEVESGATTQLLLDVDLSRTFSAVPGGRIHHPDEIQEFRFLPSLGMRLIKLATAGSIAGTVADPHAEPIADVLVTAYAEGAEVTSTVTDSDGTYKLVGLLPGTYDVEFSTPGYQDVTLQGIGVASGQETAGIDATLVLEAAGN